MKKTMAVLGTWLSFWATMLATGYSYEADSLSLLSDASGMFNERGYLKSSSFSSYGDDAISDFNGNLTWTMQLGYKPLTQDGVRLDLRLTYNGSVGHMVNAKLASADTHRAHFNMPEWIISANGIAIQTLNFENELLTFPDTTVGTSRVALDSGFAALTNGYHNCYRHIYDDNHTILHGTISILAGDGSVRTFTSMGSDYVEGGSVVAGLYETYSKDDKARGYVFANDSDVYFKLFREDGTTVLFRYYEPLWRNHPDQGSYGEESVSRMFLPIVFADRFGHSFEVEYIEKVQGTKVLGRPVAKRAGDFTLVYPYLNSATSRMSAMYVRDGNRNIFSFYMDNEVGANAWLCRRSNRAYITTIYDAAGRKTSFSYKGYYRYGKNYGPSGINDVRVYGPYLCGQTDTAFTPHYEDMGHDFHARLCRLHQVQYPDGGVVYYSYHDDPSTQWPSPVAWVCDYDTVDYRRYCQSFVYPCVRTEGFDELGRDPYFINMVVARTRVAHPEDTIPVSRDSLLFHWSNEYYTDRIDGSDRFFTERLSFVDISQDIDPRVTKLTYRYFPEAIPYQIDHRDCGWAVKLLERRVMENGVSGNALLDQDNFWQYSRLVLDSTITTKDGVENRERHLYFWGTGEDTINIDSTKTWNQWGDTTWTFYNSAYHDVNGEDAVYLTNLVDSAIANHRGVPTAKTVSEYYDSTSSLGFPGQIGAVRKYQLEDGMVTGIDTVSYEYRTNSAHNFCLGYLTKEVDPLGNVTEYFYDSANGLLSGKLRAEGIPGADWVADTALIAREGYAAYVMSIGGVFYPQTEAEVYHNGVKVANTPTGQNVTLEGSFRTDSGDVVIINCRVDGREFDAQASAEATIYAYSSLVTNPVIYAGYSSDTTTVLYSSNFNENGPSWYRRVQHFGVDSLVTYQKVNDRGQPEIFVNANGFASQIEYDRIQRVAEIFLPGTVIPGTPVCSALVAVDGQLGSVLEQCTADSIHLCDTDPGGVQSAFFSFEGFDFGVDPAEINAAWLTVECCVWHKYSVGAVATFHDYPDCGSAPAWADSCVQFFNIFDDVKVKVDVTAAVRQWIEDTTLSHTLALVPNHGKCDCWIYSSECSDPSKRPFLDIRYRADSVYSVRYVYDDDLDDGDGISVTSIVRVDSSGNTQQARVWFDGFGRAIRHDEIGNVDTLTTLTFFDYLDRVDSTADQLGFVTSMFYDNLDRTRRTDFPDSSGSHHLVLFNSADATGLGFPEPFSLPVTDLYFTHSYNENGDSALTFTDLKGQTRLTRTFLKDTILSTYFDYDRLGSPVTVIRPRGDSVRYQYNSNGLMLKEWSPDYDTIRYVYDKNGNLRFRQDGNLASDKQIKEDTVVVLDTYSVAFPGELDTTRHIVRDAGYLKYKLETSGGTPGLYNLAYIRWSGGFVDSINSCPDRIDSSVAYVYLEANDTIYIASQVHENNSGYARVDYSFRVRGRTSEWQYSTYDGLNRIVESGHIRTDDTWYGNVAHQWDTLAITPINHFFYDQISSSNCRGKLSLSYSDDDGYSYGEKYDYDSRGRLVKQTDYFDASLAEDPGSHDKYLTGDDFTIEYTHDLADQTTSIKYPEPCSLTVTYSYDDFGRLAQVGDAADPARFATIRYTDRNEIDQMILGDSLQIIDYAYNARGWLNTINGGSSNPSSAGNLFGEALFYYGSPVNPSWAAEYNGNVMAQIVSIAGSSDTSHYHYDDLNRLIQVDRLIASQESEYEYFEYDLNGNRTLYRDHESTETIYRYPDRGNQLDSIRIDSLMQLFIYDASGNLWGDGRKNCTFHYDYYNQLDSVTFPTFSGGTPRLLYGYSVSGNRVWKRYSFPYQASCDTAVGITPPEMIVPLEGAGPIDPEPEDTLCWFWNVTETHYVRGKRKVLAEFVDSTLSATYIYAGSQRIAMIDSAGQLQFYLNDHLGSARVVLAEDGTILNKYEYFAFGAADNQVVTTNQPYRYTHKPFDGERGIDLYYYGARYYDPSLGRFTQIDPLRGDYPAWGPYVYTLDNPLKFTDPDGKFVETAIDVASVALSAKDMYDDPSWANAGWLALDLACAAVPFLPAVGAVRHAAKLGKLVDVADVTVDISKVAAKATAVGADIVNVAGDIKKAVKGSYVHTFKSGNQYVGKGTVKRMKDSGREVATKFKDKLVKSRFDPSTPNTNRQAFIDEQLKLDARGGVPSERLYNVRNSPGKKLIENQR